MVRDLCLFTYFFVVIVKKKYVLKTKLLSHLNVYLGVPPHHYQANKTKNPPKIKKCAILFCRIIGKNDVSLSMSVSGKLQLFTQEIQNSLSPNTLRNFAKDVDFVQRAIKLPSKRFNRFICMDDSKYRYNLFSSVI